MKKKLFILTAVLSLGFLSACDDNEYMLDDSSSVTPTIEIAPEDAIIQANNGATVQLKATIQNPSGIASVALASAGLGLEETITVNAATYSLNKEFTVPTATKEGMYLISITANSKNLLTITKEIKLFVGNSTDTTAPVFTLVTDPEQQFKSSVDFQLKVTDNLGLKSIKVWSDDEESVKDSVELDGLADYEYRNVFTLPAGYSAKTVVIQAEATDLFGNKTMMEPTTFKVNVLPEELYIIGGATEAGWEPADAIAFNKTGEGTFEVVTTLLADGYGFKFISAKDWAHGVWGFETAMDELLPDGYSGSLFEGTGSQNISPAKEAGLYRIVVNIETLSFSIHKITYPTELFLVGGSSEAGWDQNAAIPFNKLDVGKFRIFTYLVAADGGVKFLPQLGDWANDWGMKPDTPGSLMVEGEENVPVSEDGFYVINIDFEAMTYELLKMEFGIIGDFNGWGSTVAMNYVPTKGNYEFTTTQEFAAGTFKFKWNGDNWDYNFGAPANGGEAPSGEAVHGGDNIKISEAGTYDVVLNLNPAGYTYSVVKK